MPFIDALASAPQRIISLVPSQTELLFDLGLGEKIIGVTKFCVHPSQKVKQVMQVGGTKNFRFDVIDQLQPDLIIGNKEENYKEGIEKLAEKYPVWISNIFTLEDTLVAILKIGELTYTQVEALRIIEAIEQGFARLTPGPPFKVAYLIWRNPWMGAGSNTFIDSILTLCGFRNVLSHWSRYPVLSEEQLKETRPDYIFLSSEPYPFTNKYIPELKAICPDAQVVLVDGEMFSWPGSRLIHAADYLQHMLHELQ